jgi:hypothetical protein
MDIEFVMKVITGMTVNLVDTKLTTSAILTVKIMLARGPKVKTAWSVSNMLIAINMNIVNVMSIMGSLTVPSLWGIRVRVMQFVRGIVVMDRVQGAA